MGFTDGFYNNMTINIQTLVIGGGFYGCYISEFLSRKGHDVLLVERGETLLGEASKKKPSKSSQRLSLSPKCLNWFAITNINAKVCE